MRVALPAALILLLLAALHLFDATVTSPEPEHATVEAPLPAAVEAFAAPGPAPRPIVFSSVALPIPTLTPVVRPVPPAPSPSSTAEAREPAQEDRGDLRAVAAPPSTRANRPPPEPTPGPPPPAPTPRLYPTNAEVGIFRPAVTPTPVPYTGQKLGPAVPARIAQWQEEILVAARTYNLDPNLIAALMQTESAGNPAAVSRANAVGLLQVVGGPLDPLANVLQGTKMLAHNIRLFDEDLELALAAYNAGPRNVLRYKGIPPFQETKLHIQRTMASWEKFRGG